MQSINTPHKYCHDIYSSARTGTSRKFRICAPMTVVCQINNNFFQVLNILFILYFPLTSNQNLSPDHPPGSLINSLLTCTEKLCFSMYSLILLGLLGWLILSQLGRGYQVVSGTYYFRWFTHLSYVLGRVYCRERFLLKYTAQMLKWGRFIKPWQ